MLKKSQKQKNWERFLITMDPEKAFDLLDHNFLILFSEKYGFGKDFIKRSGVVRYFTFGRNTHQSDLI